MAVPAKALGKAARVANRRRGITLILYDEGILIVNIIVDRFVVH
jgi:hypothetical protein